MLNSDSDIVVMRSVYISKSLDDAIRSVAFKADLGESELIAKLLRSSLDSVEPTQSDFDPVTVEKAAVSIDAGTTSGHQPAEKEKHAA